MYIILLIIYQFALFLDGSVALSYGSWGRGLCWQDLGACNPPKYSQKQKRQYIKYFKNKK